MHQFHNHKKGKHEPGQVEKTLNILKNNLLSNPQKTNMAKTIIAKIDALKMGDVNDLKKVQKEMNGLKENFTKATEPSPVKNEVLKNIDTAIESLSNQKQKPKP